MDWLEKLQNIPGFYEWTDFTPITKGWSEEKKFRVKIPSGEYYLIRLTDKTNLERKKREYNAIKQLSLTNLNITRPIDFGLLPSGDFVYTVYTWVKGKDAELEIPKLPSSEQYEFGRKAGSILREIHTIPALPETRPWGQYFSNKIESRIDLYHQMGVKLNYEQDIIQFMRENTKFLYERPQSLQHGDFHLGNMVLSQDKNEDSKKLGIIDFNRLSYGDPWEEFERCFFTVQKSVSFMNGQIHSYFDDHVPDLFFRLLALYTGYSCIASLPWSIPFGPEEVEKMRVMSNSVIEMFNNFQDYMPKWYKDPK